MRKMTRLATLSLLSIFVGGCSRGGVAANCIEDQPTVEDDMLTRSSVDMLAPEPVNVFAGDLTLSCTGMSQNGSSVWVYSPAFVRGPAPNFDLIPIWVPACRKNGDYHVCAAPITEEGQDWAGIVTCYITPCRGLERDKIRWVDFRNGHTVIPHRSPSSFPQVRNNDHTPKGGSDACANREYGWEFPLTE